MKLGLLEYAARRAVGRPRVIKPVGDDALLMWDDPVHSRLLRWWLRRKRVRRRHDALMAAWFAEFQSRRPGPVLAGPPCEVEPVEADTAAAISDFETFRRRFGWFFEPPEWQRDFVVQAVTGKDALELEWWRRFASKVKPGSDLPRVGSALLGSTYTVLRDRRPASSADDERELR